MYLAIDLAGTLLSARLSAATCYVVQWARTNSYGMIRISGVQPEQADRGVDLADVGESYGLQNVLSRFCRCAIFMWQ